MTRECDDKSPAKLYISDGMIRLLRIIGRRVLRRRRPIAEEAHEGGDVFLLAGLERQGGQAEHENPTHASVGRRRRGLSCG